jgi:hypothetical protein
VLNIQALKKRLIAIEADRSKQDYIKNHVPISETIALYEKYFSGELPVPDDMKGRWEADIIKYIGALDQVPDIPEDPET